MTFRFTPAVAFLLCTVGPLAAQPSKDFNTYILRSIQEVVEPRKGGGYDLHESFTQDLQYGEGRIRASSPPKTMCVAAIVEIMVEAINLYASENGDTVYDKIPLTSWTKGM